ncbi:hypothetical protein TNCV_4180181 [Trichonephila clavipes]|nr:hypothetical protein TNCV_4180181 [Trichonephila clavipes]
MRVQGPTTSISLPPTSREDLQLDDYLEYPHAPNLQTSMPSLGFKPMPYGTAVSIVNHRTGWVMRHLHKTIDTKGDNHLTVDVKKTSLQGHFPDEMGRFRSVFDGEIKAIHIAFSQLLCHLEPFSRVVVFSDSKAALQAINSTKTLIFGAPFRITNLSCGL